MNENGRSGKEAKMNKKKKQMCWTFTDIFAQCFLW